METSVATDNEGALLEELGWLRTLARRLVADPNDAEDVVQEAWLRTHQVVEQFPSRGRLRAWLAGLVYRMAKDNVRARWRRERREEIVALSARRDAEDGVERLAALESLLHTVRTLDEPLRSVVLLRYLDGHSTSEIAAALGISEELVRKRLTRARAALRRVLGVPDEPEARTLLGRGLALGVGLLLVAGLVFGLRSLSKGVAPAEPELAAPTTLPLVPAAMSVAAPEVEPRVTSEPVAEVEAPREAAPAPTEPAPTVPALEEAAPETRAAEPALSIGLPPE